MPLPTILTSFAIAVAALAVPLSGAAQPAPPGYDRPPQNILDVMQAASPPVPSVSPTRDTMLLVSWQDYPTIARVATPFLRLAGARVEPKNRSRHDTPGGYGIAPCAASFELVRIADKLHRRVALPAGGCAAAPVWAADGKRFAFAIAAADSVELWIGDAVDATARRVPGVRLNSMLGQELQWLADQKTLLVKLVPAGLSAPPSKPLVPAGPSIQETGSGKGQSSTYEHRAPATALLHEYDENRHWQRSFVVDVDEPAKAPRLLWDLSTDEKYAHPGTPVRRVLANGAVVMRQDGDAIYLSGLGASPDGDRPFLDRLDLGTRKSERLFRSDRDAFERFLAFTGADSRSFLSWRQSAIDPPNAFVRTLGGAAVAVAGEPAFASERVAVTHVTDPAPAVRAIKKRLVKYKRADGLDLSFTLYTPPGYQEGMRVPTILYAYPLDYADPAKAGQVTGSQATFTRLRLHRLLLLAGYALIDGASFPVVGDPKKAYDDYLDQLVADARAAVDEAVRLGVADPERIGVTGHSHGALMTVNLLAHSNLFRAGVATSGSYNKTLTPFGFQSERRSVWDAPDVYRKVSPFFFADKLKTPLLIIHGADDANPGTTPLQATKLYEAVRGNGGTARLVMLPHEPHWYSAIESNEQVVYEMVRWFDTYVKNAPVRAAAAAPG